MSKTIALIPARGGSQSIPRKNIKLLGNKPLVAWPIELALSIPQIDRVIVSSDDDEIMTIAQKYGAEVLFKRPQDLSGSDVPTLPVLQHAVNYLRKSEGYFAENVLLLYPTTPFLKKERILEGIDLLNDGADSVIGVRKIRGYIWKKTKNNENKLIPFYPPKRVNRQKFEHLLEEVGNIYFMKSSVLIEQNRIVSEENCQFIFVGQDEILDIDEPSDFLEAEERLRKN
ncbi:MAG: pseudaminic acid cytidylyltransferase [Patescibacteria group bacterium]|nr:MAG: pseudaminic acid cytidylyltransferase [Patescibacteria group bacterium]